MSVQEMCLERKMCASLRKVKDCKTCKHVYVTCEEWVAMKELKELVIEVLIKTLRRYVN